ncbi:unnamed protein product [Caenorhabditis brenneri]
MRPWLLIILLSFFFFINTAECQEKRSSMGGSAFGSLDRIPLSYLRKYYRQKTTKRDDNDYLNDPMSSKMSFWPLY